MNRAVTKLRDRIFNAGHPVEEMKRIAIANIVLGSVPTGGHRAITVAELAGLEAALRGERVAPPVRPVDRRRRKRQTSHKKSVR